MDISEILSKLNEYTEEPDAFETQTERESEQEYLSKLDKEYKEQDKQNKQEFFRKRNYAINRVYSYLNKVNYVHDLSIVKGVDDKRYNYISFYIPKLSLWNYLEGRLESLLKEGNLKATSYNASSGYNVTIQ